MKKIYNLIFLISPKPLKFPLLILYLYYNTYTLFYWNIETTSFKEYKFVCPLGLTRQEQKLISG